MNRETAIANLAALGFSAVACAGIVIGREWKLLLAPLAIVPIIRMVGSFIGSGDMPGGPRRSLFTAALHDIVHATIPSAVACPFVMSLADGRCAWAAGTMAAAMSAIAASAPFLGRVQYRTLLSSALLAASAVYALVAFVSKGDSGWLVCGTAITFPIYAIVRVAIAARDWRKGKESAR